MFADLNLENRVLKDVVEKAFEPTIKCELVGHLKEIFNEYIAVL